MSSKSVFSAHALLVGAIALFPALCLADGLTINFSGAIVEPPCTVTTGDLNYAAGDLTRLRDKRAMASSTLDLSLKCHAAQSVQISFEQGGRETRAGFATGVEGVTMAMSHNGRELPPGEIIPLALATGQQKQLRLDTQLLGASASPQEKVRSAILVSLNYR
ncbi:fimbrial protein [Herbaspirillum chlorophenolicum]|uniref:Fimbrial protein n=1 Tax=Herbaspirillum chlorophenolicum TaxID=211589 RepID=A0ABW8EVW5_9BURK